MFSPNGNIASIQIKWVKTFNYGNLHLSLINMPKGIDKQAYRHYNIRYKKVKRGWGDRTMANRTKTKRNAEILKRWKDGQGMTQRNIARMLQTTEKAVNGVIYRHNLTRRANSTG
jgi:hypothetical protein